MNIPDEFGLFPFQRFTADELQHFFVWCAAHEVSNADLTGGSPTSVSRFDQRVCCSGVVLPTTLMSSLIDELFGREVIPRVPAGDPVDRTTQVSGGASGRHDLKRRECIRLRSHFIQGTSSAEERAISITMRIIPTETLDILSISIEPGLLEATVYKSDLGFVCGEAGPGKLTLCSALYRYIMDNSPDAEIMTYKDPVEYILGNGNDLLPPHQVEVGRDVVSFTTRLRPAVRRNPEVIGIGEIRGNKTVDAAVQAGNTGHCCLNAMHMKSPGETLARLLGLLPSAARNSVTWAVLSLLQSILVQVLVRTNDGDRKAVREYIVISDGSRDNLSGMPHVEWGHHIGAIIRQEKRRIRGQILEMYIWDRVGRRGAILSIPLGELRS